MKEFGTLLTTSRNSHARRLLSAGLRDRPPPNAQAAAAAALGLVTDAAVAASASAARPFGGGEISGAAQFGASHSARPLVLAVAKWLGLGALAGTLSSAAWSAIAPDTATPAFPARPIVARGAPGGAPLGPAASVGAHPPPVGSRAALAPQADAPRVQPAIEAPSVMLGTASSAHGFTPEGDLAPEPPGGQLAREAALVDRARAALAVGDLGTASQALRNYEEIRRVGALDREAQFLSIDLAVRKGDRAHAVSLAAEFERIFPGDAYLLRIRRLITSLPP